jgi:hypothetical protein
MRFKIIDKTTGKSPDLEKIALTEKWAKNLCYCDMEGFALLPHGELILLDKCGRFEYLPTALQDRFEIVDLNAKILLPHT